MPKLNFNELKRSALELVKATQIPVSIGYVAEELGIAWGTARAILLELALEDRVEGLKTMKSWVFMVKKNEGGHKNIGTPSGS